MKFIPLALFIICFGGLFSCKSQSKEKANKESFESIINDSRVNTKEVGESEGIRYFQIEKDGKTGFCDLDGNIVVEPKLFAL